MSYISLVYSVDEMKVHAVIAFFILFLLGLLTNQLASSRTIVVDERTSSGVLQGFPRESSQTMVGIIERLISHRHPGVPKISFKQGEEALVAKLDFPVEAFPISMLTDELRVGIMRVLEHLRKSGLRLAVNDKHELVNQFLVTEDGQPILATLEKVVVDYKGLSKDTLKLLNPYPGK